MRLSPAGRGVTRMYHLIQHWLAYMTGSLNTSGAPPNYNFWSGFGSDIAEVTIIAGLVAVYRKHNCHVARCWRIGRYPFTDEATGTAYLLCRRHHPGVGAAPVTARQIREKYRMYLGRHPGRG